MIYRTQQQAGIHKTKSEQVKGDWCHSKPNASSDYLNGSSDPWFYNPIKLNKRQKYIELNQYKQKGLDAFEKAE